MLHKVTVRTLYKVSIYTVCISILAHIFAYNIFVFFRLQRLSQMKTCCAWGPSIRNHFWYCSKSCENDAKKFKASYLGNIKEKITRFQKLHNNLSTNCNRTHGLVYCIMLLMSMSGCLKKEAMVEGVLTSL